ncbi:MAG: hypothetical protein Q4D87_02780 [Actinomycetaceae bacterium]|nr:hypothetical protein [Actinomycetaceae bacterium]
MIVLVVAGIFFANRTSKPSEADAQPTEQATTEESVTEEPESEATEEAEEAPTSELAGMYMSVLDDEDYLKFFPEELKDNEDYAFESAQYALVEISGDDNPELLVKTDGVLSPVWFVSNEGHIITPDVTVGTASDNQFEGILYQLPNASLIYGEYNPETGDGAAYELKSPDGPVQRTEVAQIVKGAVPADLLSDAELVEFFDASDRSHLQDLP